ncbi:hypothetical protein FOXG_07293 [Fusarium oxysporum f. sp. lycopersici 4287]|uniref:Uncharacterized protein n=1 Tax=Fusarium oxysporum f. sp. lycopersici (strain 4287 / CBS 123668 / FGSC 9935 / NRRL 34936) TaxID=426428 RepID=A0A0J9V5W2_FUSO4|nr:hypothetical protein FOXG_07293 [Fusarium oxysporum f. sp. lycopersici 4287]KAJ9419278.1 hypothetical protein QL093DRAFT_2101365 [Fusarium oxysporum]KNB06615.1 hypothetical protein FOXG_07293 [Fusarium oxysporum f. sp. lycopersici 4287]
MDVYTNPPSNTYSLGTLFTLPTKAGGVPAISIKSSNFPILIAAYSILIQIIFASLWQFLANLVLLFHALRDADAGRARYVALVAFWNSSNPWTAITTMGAFLCQATINGGNGRVSRPEKFHGIILFLLSVIIAFGGIAASIFIPNAMSLGPAAPVHPKSVFLPELEDIASSSSIRIDRLNAPAILRALGSTEAFKDVTARKNVDTVKTTLPGSNATHPRQRYDYRYTITAREFGLQAPLEFSHKVQGSCITEYNWLRPVPDIADPARFNGYVPFDLDPVEPILLDPTDNMTALWTQPSMGIEYHPSDEDLTITNRSFALIPQLAHAGSITASTDPWYLTEPFNSETEGFLGYRVKSGRPAMSCWEESLLCLHKTCTSVDGIKKTPLPKGLRIIVMGKFSIPVLTKIILSAGPAALKSVAGIGWTGLLDCASSTLKDDLDRLVLAAYLNSREVFRETALLGPQAGMSNILESANGDLFPGSADFVMLTGDVTAISYSSLIAIPVTCLAVTFLAAMLPLVRKMVLKAPTTNRRRASVTYAALCAGLRATQLYRMVDEKILCTPDWINRKNIIPLPPPVETMPRVLIPSFVGNAVEFQEDGEDGDGGDGGDRCRLTGADDGGRRDSSSIEIASEDGVSLDILAPP